MRIKREHIHKRQHPNNIHHRDFYFNKTLQHYFLRYFFYYTGEKWKKNMKNFTHENNKKAKYTKTFTKNI